MSNHITAELIKRLDEYDVLTEGEAEAIADGVNAALEAAPDPEHVALMEAVCEAAMRSLDFGLPENMEHRGIPAALMDSSDALAAYRKGHGLE